MRKNFIAFTSLIFLLALVGGLAGCGPMAFTPEEAALRSALETGPQGRIIDQSSVQVLQTVKNGDVTVVAISYNQMYEGRNEQCIMAYQVRRSPLGGWLPGSGGGGCSGQLGGEEAPPPEPLEVGAGISSGSRPNDPGVSDVYGRVHDENIRKVLVTWEDGMQQDVEVVNNSYIAVRIGQFQVNTVEGLDDAGERIYQFDRNHPAPGKQ